MARANDPNPTWVDIRDPSAGPDHSSPSELGWVPEDHLYLVSPADAKPQDAEANMALWAVVRSDEPESVISELTDFLRLPPTVQKAVSRSGAEAARPVFVVANCDRVREYYPKNPAGVRPFLASMLQAGVLPIFVEVGPPGGGHGAFDFVFEVEARDPENWREAIVTCHKAPPGSSIPLETAIPLASFSGATEILEKRISSND